jgi:hypothetical protein
VSFDALATRKQLALLERLERVRRLLPVPEHPLINQIPEQATPAEIGGKLAHVLADRLRITRREAKRRIQQAEDLADRRSLTGQPLAPRLAATAAAQRAGHIGAGHIAVIRRFFEQLPCWIDAPTRDKAEKRLAKLATEFRPDQLAKLADKLTDCLNPDGIFSDEDRARRRGLTLGKQDIDGMSPIRGRITPGVRASREAVLARWAAPGMCNPYDAGPPVTDGPPSQQVIESDTRSAGQRNHDAFSAVLRALLASGQLGQHNGLPASIIVTTTLHELQTGCGKALTGGGSLLPMSEVLRMAGHAHQLVELATEERGLQPFSSRRWPGSLDAYLVTRLG